MRVELVLCCVLCRARETAAVVLEARSSCLLHQRTCSCDLHTAAALNIGTFPWGMRTHTLNLRHASTINSNLRLRVLLLRVQVQHISFCDCVVFDGLDPLARAGVFVGHVAATSPQRMYQMSLLRWIPYHSDLDRKYQGSQTRAELCPSQRRKAKKNEQQGIEMAV